MFLELLIKEDPGVGNLITFSQFLAISLEGFIFTSKFGKVERVIPLKQYMILVSMFFVTNVCNNYAFNFNVPIPLQLVFSSSTLTANMIAGIIIMKKKYESSKYVSVALITVGILLCTFVSGKNVEHLQSITKPLELTTPLEDFYRWMIGISLLTLGLFTLAGTGLYQETLTANYGKHPKESLFYVHVLALPFFISLLPNIYKHFIIIVQSRPIEIIGFMIPRSILHLIGNLLTQYMCVCSIFKLITEYSSLTVTLVLTLRKFCSLLISVMYFNDAFTIYHWIGTIFVFSGTFMYTALESAMVSDAPKSVKYQTRPELDE
ncbi:UDP-xylose and UDP-N-acetylglucosamine transporter-like isoform X2 [Venturia canescens]|nr:UDP-xylose and UDP-N-acetylglucosamine transporter-like isoform X2 [Venturia canescens]